MWPTKMRPFWFTPNREKNTQPANQILLSFWIVLLQASVEQEICDKSWKTHELHHKNTHTPALIMISTHTDQHCIITSCAQRFPGTDKMNVFDITPRSNSAAAAVALFRVFDSESNRRALDPISIEIPAKIASAGRTHSPNAQIPLGENPISFARFLPAALPARRTCGGYWDVFGARVHSFSGVCVCGGRAHEFTNKCSFACKLEQIRAVRGQQSRLFRKPPTLVMLLSWSAHGIFRVFVSLQITEMSSFMEKR